MVEESRMAAVAAENERIRLNQEAAAEAERLKIENEAKIAAAVAENEKIRLELEAEAEA